MTNYMMTEHYDNLVLEEKIEKKAKKKLLLEYKYAQYKAIINSKVELDDYILRQCRNALKETKKYQKMSVGSNYYFVSVSPLSGTGIDALIKKVEKYTSRKMIVGAYYTYEWNKNGDPHCHILVYQCEYSDRDFKQNTKNTFKSLVGNLRCIDIRRVPDSWVEDKLLYIKGEKWDEDKDEMIEIDKKNRLEFQLESYYSIGNFLHPDKITDEITDKKEEGGERTLDAPPTLAYPKDDEFIISSLYL